MKKIKRYIKYAIIAAMFAAVSEHVSAAELESPPLEESANASTQDIQTLSEEEIDKMLEGSQLIYDSNWGDEAEINWDDAYVAEDVVEDTEISEEWPSGTLVLKANVAKEIMAETSGIQVTIEDESGGSSTYLLVYYNGYLSTSGIAVGKYKITEVIPLDYTGEYKITTAPEEFEMENMGSVNVSISIGPAEADTQMENETAEYQEDNGSGIISIVKKYAFAIFIGAVVLGAAVIFYIKKINKINPIL